MFSQTCGTPIPTSANTYIQPLTSRSYNYNDNICLDIQFHVVRNTDGSLAFNPRNIDEILSELNLYFNSHQIFFNSLGVNFIDNSNYISVEESEFNNLTDIDNNANALNFYIVDDMWGNTAGAAYIASNRLVVKNIWATSVHAAHEVGHCFDLHHTHETEFGSEAIDGSNCFTAGDLICDTPADPLIGNHNVNSNCEYEENNGYNPLTNNIMSYSRRICKDEFTNGQGYRMRQALLNNSVLQALLNGSCNVGDIEWLHDNGVAVCLNQNKTFGLSNIPANNNIEWTVTNNLNIINQTYNDITVKLNSLYAEEAIITGQITIENIDYIFTLELNQLTTPTSNSITLESFRSDPIYIDRWTNITAKYNSLIDVGQLGYNWEWVVPSHQIRSNSPSYSYIHVKPIVTLPSVYIKTRAENECGCSDWKGKWFTVKDPPNGCTSCPTDGSEVHY